MKLILASKSPRRKDILLEFGYTFDIVTADFNEVCLLNNPEKTAMDNAFGKANAVYKKLSDKSMAVIGSDTIVCYGGEILGKPTDEKDAMAMLEKLSGKTHQVISGYAVVSSEQTIVGTDKSLVTFNKLSPELIKDYIKSGSPLDKAGAYGIQDDFPIVKNHSGSLYNIIGLPIEKLKPILDNILKTEK